LWQERPSRTLAEEFQAPLEGLLMLVSGSRMGYTDAEIVELAQRQLIQGVHEMLSVAADAQLEGVHAGIDAANLVDALDSLLLIGLKLPDLIAVSGEGTETEQSLKYALYTCFRQWLESLQAQTQQGVPSRAPLRKMVLESTAPDLAGLSANDDQTARLMPLIATLQEQLKSISVH
jgi:hypothetical protein